MDAGLSSESDGIGVQHLPKKRNVPLQGRPVSDNVDIVILTESQGRLTRPTPMLAAIRRASSRMESGSAISHHFWDTERVARLVAPPEAAD